jgi:hypothetical protein
MAAGRVRTTKAEIDAALERVKNEPELPRALAAEYNSALDVVVLRIDNGRRLVIPREEMQGLENATPAQLAEIEIHGGLDIAWPQLDVDHYLPYLLEGKYATERWKQERERHKVAA